MDNRYKDMMQQGFMKQKKKTVKRKTNEEKLAELRALIPYPVFPYGDKFQIDMPEGFTNTMSYTDAKKTFGVRK